MDHYAVEAWLADWSRLESMLAEAAAIANFEYSGDTADPEREEAELRFSSEIAPRAKEQRTRLQARLVGLGYTRPDLETTVRRFRNQMELFTEANVPLFAELAKLSTEWAKIIGAMTVTWDGEEKTPAQISPYLEERDRTVRERWSSWSRSNWRASTPRGGRCPSEAFWGRIAAPQCLRP